MDAGVRLDIEYDTVGQPTNKSTATIVSTGNEHVNSLESICKNSSSEQNETLALDFGTGTGQTLLFKFTRDQKITGDKNEQKWQLYEIVFKFFLRLRNVSAC